jgi:hypothetical protein
MDLIGSWIRLHDHPENNQRLNASVRRALPGQTSRESKNILIERATT